MSLSVTEKALKYDALLPKYQELLVENARLSSQYPDINRYKDLLALQQLLISELLENGHQVCSGYGITHVQLPSVRTAYMLK